MRAEAPHSWHRLISRTAPTHWRDPITFFAESADVESRTLLLRPATGEALVGLGSATMLVAYGPDRFEQVAAAWRALLDDALIDARGTPGPIALGGFSFDPTRPSTGLWDGYPSARMVLPERLLAQRGEGAWLTTNLAADDVSGGANTEAAVQNLELGRTAEEWRELVGETAQKIGSGELGVRKLVLARAMQVTPRRSIEEALRSLVAEYPRCTIFALAQGDACFLGATPERLISLRGGIASTMALAGSALRGSSPDEDEQLSERLRSDPKEVGEHTVVVEAIREALADVCERVVVDAEPRVEQLSNVQHLLSRIRGQVSDGRNVLELVQRLHPTPAVGGYPRRPSLELIRQLEGLDRGWYAAPIGSMGANGDGEFVVGLRSALVSDNTATLFAGCGIVADSEPHTEYAEWGWKLRPMLNALGAQP